VGEPGETRLLVGKKNFSWEEEPDAAPAPEAVWTGSGPVPRRYLYLVTEDGTTASEVWKEAAIAGWMVQVRFRVGGGGRARTWRGELAGIRELPGGPDAGIRWLIVLRRSA